MIERKGRINRLKEPRLINRRAFEEKTASNKWWSDPTKLLPIVISIFALFISYLSWRESHRGRVINEEINRPILTFSEIESSYGSSSVEGADIVVSFRVKLKNTGKSTAKIQGMEVSPIFSRAPQPGCKITSLLDMGLLPPSLTGAPPEILPNMDGNFFGGVNVSSKCNKQSITFFVMTTVAYSDLTSSSEKRYLQTFPERVNVSIDLSSSEEK